MKRILLATLAAALCATSLPACKTMEKRSDGENAIIAAGVGILAALVGKAAQAGSAGGGSAAAGGTISGDINAAKALRHLYGNLQTKKLAFDSEGTVKEWAYWKLPADFLKDRYDDNPGDVAVYKIAEKRYVEKDVEKYMLTTQAAFLNGEDGYRGCPSIVFGVALFYKEEGQWKLDAEDKTMSACSFVDGYSDAGDFSTFTQVGPEKYGIVDIGGYTGGGGFSLHLGVLMYDNHHFGWLPLCDEEASNMSDPPVGTYDCEVKFDKSSAGEYYDAIVSYKTRASKRAKEVKKTKRLRFVDGEYKEVKAAAKNSAKKRK